ncbi:MAG: radical SAM protein [Elusimicrobia bacterium]|nr:radical SAM protein [Elusimicrobiota bacterium]
MKRIFWYIKINGIRAVFRILISEIRIFLNAATPEKIVNIFRELSALKKCSADTKGFPHRYYIEPTNYCQLSCPFCLGNRRSSRQKGSMPLGLYKKIIDDISPYAVAVNLYLNGESFLHKDIIEMINYTRSRRISVKIDTNMHVMDVKTAEKLVGSGLERLIVDIDGADQETYARYRAGGNLEKVLNNMSLLSSVKKRMRSKRPVIEVRSILMRYNEGQTGEIKRMSYSCGADNVFFVPMTMDAKNDSVFEQWAPSDRDKSLYDPVTRDNRFAAKKGNPCPELWTLGFIRWDGTVIACCMDDEGKGFGKISEGSSFADIWNGRDFAAARNAVCGRDTDIVNDCTGCRGKIKLL